MPMLMTLVFGACFFAVMQCFEKAVAQSGEQFKSVSPVKCPSQFTRQRKGLERLPAKDWIEAMPVPVLQHMALNIIVQFGFPTEITLAAAVQRRMDMEEAS